MRPALPLLAVSFLLAQDTALEPAATFGTTVVSSSSFVGAIFAIPPDTETLPDFRKLKPLGSVYTDSLRITPRPFAEGFPGVTDRSEWFAIDYNGRFWVEADGNYRFRLLSDDGSKLWLDGKLVVDNDGTHAPLLVEGGAHLSRGVHRIRVAYFQGPRLKLALTLQVAPPDQGWRYFDLRDFRPPADPALWVPGKISKIKRGQNW